MSTTLKPLWADFAYKEHQIAGVTWMLAREKATAGPRGGILCDEMGLGKTIQMVALMKLGVTKPHEQNLLIAPVAVLEQWKTVIRRAGMTVIVPAKGARSWEVQGTPASVLAPHVYVIGYEMAQRHPALVTAYAFDRLVYDEAHRIGSDNAATDLAKGIKAPRKWLLTATPIVNKVRDLTTLLSVIGVEFHEGITKLDALLPLIKTYVLARTMDQLRASIPDAPPKPMFKDITLEFATEEEAEFYRGIQGILTRRWRALASDSGAGAALEKLKLFMRLRQLSLHPQVYIDAQKKRLKNLYTRPDWTGSSTKFDAVCRLMRDSTKSHRWIIFCHFHKEMDLLAQLLRAESCVETVNIYHGGLSAAQKQDVLERTQLPVAEGKQEVLLVQLQSGGTGLNLQHFDRIIFSGPWWTSALMEQAVGRAVRIGQHKVVKVFHLRLAEEQTENIDMIMHKKAAAKGDLCREVLSNATTAVKVAELA